MVTDQRLWRNCRLLFARIMQEMAAEVLTDRRTDSDHGRDMQVSEGKSKEREKKKKNGRRAQAFVFDAKYS